MNQKIKSYKLDFNPALKPLSGEVGQLQNDQKVKEQIAKHNEEAKKLIQSAMRFTFALSQHLDSLKSKDDDLDIYTTPLYAMIVLQSLRQEKFDNLVLQDHEQIKLPQPLIPFLDKYIKTHPILRKASGSLFAASMQHYEKSLEEAALSIRDSKLQSAIASSSSSSISGHLDTMVDFIKNNAADLTSIGGFPATIAISAYKAFIK